MDIKVPSVGESVSEATVSRWLKQEGEAVARDEAICEIETDKVNIEIYAETDGLLRRTVAEGATVAVGSVIGQIEEGAAAPATETEKDTRPAPPPPSPALKTKPSTAEDGPRPSSPAARQLALQKGIDRQQLSGGGRGGRVRVDDVLAAEARMVRPEEPAPDSPGNGTGRETRQPMTPLRRRIAERLLAARQQTAMLTTFNEADMSRVLALRKSHGERFIRKHGVKLGLMSFFVKACVEALKDFPEVNARIDGEDLVYHHYYDIGIAIGGDKGLVVPVLRDADHLDFAGIDGTIADFTEKVRTRRIELSELTGGTFTISNGGVYGSLLSTPILNPPQSAILGMHAIQERPVAIDGEVVIRPMMYLALSYDHRIIDGRQAVQFLKRVKELIEDPEEMLLEL